MCYVCSCFGWIIDIIQRLLTFCLACVMCTAICIGLVIVISAGIAYGYNYMMAEFLTLTRSDVYVYIRRGQFYEKSDVKPNFRRTGEKDLFSSNSSDYQDTKTEDKDVKRLPNTWRKAIDRRNYAENLVSFSGNVKNATVVNNSEITMDNATPTKLLHMRATTVVWIYTPTATTTNTQRENMEVPDLTTTFVDRRKYGPGQPVTIAPPVSYDEALYQDADRPTVELNPKSWQYRRKLKEAQKRGVESLNEHRSSHSVADVDEDDKYYKPV